jgi:hypothetical protein
LLNKFGFTNVKGIIDGKSKLFKETSFIVSPAKITNTDLAQTGQLDEIQKTINKLYELKLFRMKNFCEVEVINAYAGADAQRIVQAYRQSKSEALAAKLIKSVALHLNDFTEFKSSYEKCENLNKDATIIDLLKQDLNSSNGYSVFSWNQDEIWDALKTGILKDKDDILQASKLAHVEPRMVVATMFAEQSRMFRTQRGLFKKYLSPLKILASANQFSLGVMGIKPKTAEDVEKHLKDTLSPFYLGPEYEKLLEFSKKNISQERYDRLSHPTKHFYSYLYGSLLIRQLEKQWETAGYPITFRPDVVGTLYNIGFQHSTPNKDPMAGGAIIDINGQPYSYGALVYEFYYSGELLNEFPYETEAKANIFIE